MVIIKSYTLFALFALTGALAANPAVASDTATDPLPGTASQKIFERLGAQGQTQRGPDGTETRAVRSFSCANAFDGDDETASAERVLTCIGRPGNETEHQFMPTEILDELGADRFLSCGSEFCSSSVLDITCTRRPRGNAATFTYACQIRDELHSVNRDSRVASSQQAKSDAGVRAPSSSASASGAQTQK